MGLFTEDQQEEMKELFRELKSEGVPDDEALRKAAEETAAKETDDKPDLELVKMQEDQAATMKKVDELRLRPTPRPAHSPRLR